MNTDETPAESARSGSTIYMFAATSAIASAFLFTASHGIVRHIGSTMHPFQIAFFSTLFSALFYVPLIAREGIGLLATKKIKLHIIRAMFNAGSLILWYLALPITFLADATALALAGPLFATVGAVLFLGERMRARRWSALIIGVIGALIIVRPGFATFSLGFTFVILAAMSSAVARLFAKHLTRWDRPVTCSAYVAILQTPITFALALTVWQTPTLRELAWLAAVGVFVALAQVTLVQALRLADVGAMEPLNVTRLIWAGLIGYFAFDQLPVAATWIGGAIIVAASTYIARRESRATVSGKPAKEDPP